MFAYGRQARTQVAKRKQNQREPRTKPRINPSNLKRNEGNEAGMLCSGTLPEKNHEYQETPGLSRGGEVPRIGLKGRGGKRIRA